MEPYNLQCYTNMITCSHGWRRQVEDLLFSYPAQVVLVSAQPWLKKTSRNSWVFNKKMIMVKYFNPTATYIYSMNPLIFHKSVAHILQKEFFFPTNGNSNIYFSHLLVYLFFHNQSLFPFGQLIFFCTLTIIQITFKYWKYTYY